MSEPSAHNAEVVSQFSRQAEGYSRLTEAPQFAKRPGLHELLSATSDDIVLDVCCGPGFNALDLAPFVHHVTGLDLTPAMLAEARAAQARRGVANADWLEGDIGALPFADDAFSIVFCGSAFHHLTDPVAALREMSRVCRSGGRVAVRDVTPEAAKSAAYDRMEVLRDPSHVHALTLGELSALGETLALSVPMVTTHVTRDLKLDDVLATSFPKACTRSEIYDRFLADASSGADEHGFSARLVEGDVKVSYRVSTAVWRKTG